MIERRRIAVEGLVQGVGFRPFVHGLATSLRLNGFVRNASAGVLIEVEGEHSALDGFLLELTLNPPPLAEVTRVRHDRLPPSYHAGFAIAASDARTELEHDPVTGRGGSRVAPDVATCDDCLRDMRDPTDRRYRYPFINCAWCGPRFTIVRELPYDRRHTSMAAFHMCEPCRREYGEPSDRRHHAQAIACPACGPTLSFATAGAPGHGPLTGEAALAAAVHALLDDRIVAVKGLGGFHLACLATSARAAERLRSRKAREAKPFAVMVADLSAAAALCHVSRAEGELLRAAERPIVLLEKREAGAVADAVAPEQRRLGLMLPYTPLHHLLLAEVKRPLVMTSGNLAGEPIAYEDADAADRLAPIADGILAHDRSIVTPCEDSVVQETTLGTTFVRRSRGYAPRPLTLARAVVRPALGVGGHLKNTFCLAADPAAYLSPHIGDLDAPAARQLLAKEIVHFEALLGVAPEVVGHDLHPDYGSTWVADALAHLPRVAVQHHHAHVASCVAEHGVTEPVLGVAFDGTGLGTDGAIWGGEFLRVDGAHVERVAHLGYVRLPGGDAAVKRPWRSAASHLWAAYGPAMESLPLEFVERAAPGEWSLVRQLLANGACSPNTSSMGRLFDAVAALAGVRDTARYEAEAAIELEAIADRGTTRSYPVELSERGDAWIVEPAPIVRAIVTDLAGGTATSAVAGAFHNTVRDMVIVVASKHREATGIRRVALTGGVFQNVLLLERVAAALSRLGFEPLVHRLVPCNDGGLSLGQACVAGGAH